MISIQLYSPYDHSGIKQCILKSFWSFKAFGCSQFCSFTFNAISHIFNGILIWEELVPNNSCLINPTANENCTHFSSPICILNVLENMITEIQLQRAQETLLSRNSLKYVFFTKFDRQTAGWYQLWFPPLQSQQQSSAHGTLCI